MLQACQILSTIIRDPEHRLSTVDVSSNEFTAEHIDIFRIAVATSSSIVSFDLRGNPGYNDGKCF